MDNEQDTRTPILQYDLLNISANALEALDNLDFNKAYTITLKERQELYDREFNKLMELSKEELVVLLIGKRPVW